MSNLKVKTEVVKLHNGKYSVYIESKLLGGEINGERFGESATSKPFKTFKSEKRAVLCKKRLDKISKNKKFAWTSLAKKPKLKC